MGSCCTCLITWRQSEDSEAVDEISVDEIVGGVRFFAGLSFLFRRPIDGQLAQLTLQTHLASRQRDLFELAHAHFRFPRESLSRLCPFGRQNERGRVP